MLDILSMYLSSSSSDLHVASRFGSGLSQVEGMDHAEEWGMGHMVEQNKSKRS